MTTLSFNDLHFVATNRAPSKSFAARLAALQAAQESRLHLNKVLGFAGRLAAAAVPAGALAYLFVFV